MMGVHLYVARKAWDAKRFGLSPHKFARRLLNGSGPKILCVTIPKAGTHLLERALCLHPPLYRKALPTIHADNIQQWGSLGEILSALSPGQIVMSHLHFSHDRWQSVVESGTRCIFMVRDPRDVVVSQAHYILGQRRHRNHELFRSQKSFRDCVSLSIVGHPDTNLLSIGETLRRFEGWMRDGVLVVRFEDLVGSQGQGNDTRQREALKTIYNHIGLELDAQTLSHLAFKTFSNRSPTFKNGVAGRWKDDFDDELKEQFKESAAEAIVRYGYESDDKW